MRKQEVWIGIPGDGRCLFRSVIHGTWLRSRKRSPSERSQKALADELRAKITWLELDRWRTNSSEEFVEGDFDKYVVRMRQPHIWGREPELLMCAHVLKTSISVYMKDKRSGGSLKIISEYGRDSRVWYG